MEERPLCEVNYSYDDDDEDNDDDDDDDDDDDGGNDYRTGKQFRISNYPKEWRNPRELVERRPWMANEAVRLTGAGREGENE